MSIITATVSNFREEVLQSEVPVLVDFWASWCGPCRMLSPVVDEIAESADGFKVAKVNVDDEMELAEAYNISSIPCLIVFKNGAEAKRNVGVIPAEQILNLVKNA